MMGNVRKPARTPRFASRRRVGKRKGATLIESALVLLTLIWMIIFVMDMGRLLLTQQLVTERARIAARNAAVNNWNAATVANFASYNSTTSSSSGPGLLGLQPSQVSYQTLGTPGAPDYRLRVTIQGLQAFTWIPFLDGKYTAAPVVATTPAQSLGATN
jgi:uncharacterized membrane protein